MKKLFIILVSVMLISNITFAQKAKDIINLKTGESIKCIIQKVDTVDYSLTYIDAVLNVQKVISLDYVGSYSIDGVINAGLPIVKSKVIIPISASPITQKKINNDAGAQLVKFANQAQTGIVMMIAGSIITSASMLTDNSETQKVLVYSGLAVSTVGLIINMASYANARKAGKIMQLSQDLSMHATQDGIGLAMRIK
jgi:hypothetical protein